MSPKNSISIDPQIRQLATRYEEPGKQLILALQVATSIGIYEVSCNIVESKPLKLLEEFVLRAALEINPSIHWMQLASVLKVDERFIRDTKSELQRLRAITNGDNLEITEQGKKFYHRGTIDSDLKTEKWYILSIPSINRVIATDTNIRLLEETDHSKLDSIADFNVDQLSTEDIIKLTTDAGLRYHDNTQQIVACNSIEHISNGYLEWSICSFLDLIDGNLTHTCCTTTTV